ncbi:unnamed protein product [Hymenolepis diminuta]|uniref:DUF7041 domain-containing protein n=1 Tax=Hymenolepis diminuta TaxID=6216 RepID=A0A564Z729_HYMDI|nr:unnamed protein product [Hymenolepis diminuta]
MQWSLPLLVLSSTQGILISGTANWRTPFNLRGITKQKIMFQHAFSALPTDVAAEVIDIVDKAPEDNSYDTFKEAVIGRLSDSQEKPTCYRLRKSRGKRKRKTPKSTAVNQQKPSQSVTQHRSPKYQLLLHQREKTTRISPTKTISINMSTSSQPPSPSFKLQTINHKLRPSVLPKATLTRKCNTRNLLADNIKSKSGVEQTPKERTTDA